MNGSHAYSSFADIRRMHHEGAFSSVPTLCYLRLENWKEGEIIRMNAGTETVVVASMRSDGVQNFDQQHSMPACIPI